MLEQPIPTDIKIERFDMAINFYAIVNIEGQPNLVCYDYNPAWNSWYPFYDDINKIPAIQKSKSKTYKDLIKECDKILNIDLQQKLSQAKDRFKQLVGDTEIKLDKLDNFTVYEIKYSKTANLHTIYKLFNFVITKAEDSNVLLNPKELNCKTFNLNHKQFQNLIGNAEYILQHEDIQKFCL